METASMIIRMPYPLRGISYPLRGTSSRQRLDTILGQIDLEADRLQQFL